MFIYTSDFDADTHVYIRFTYMCDFHRYMRSARL